MEINERNKSLYSKIESEIKKYSYKNVLEKRQEKLIKLFIKMLKFKNKEYDKK